LNGTPQLPLRAEVTWSVRLVRQSKGIPPIRFRLHQKSTPAVSQHLSGMLTNMVDRCCVGALQWTIGVCVQAGKATQARLLLAKGCENCPTNDDVWLENARVQSNSDNAKAVLARGVAAIPNSIKLWLQVKLSC
jgi:hypothetical protein